MFHQGNLILNNKKQNRMKRKEKGRKEFVFPVYYIKLKFKKYIT